MTTPVMNLELFRKKMDDAGLSELAVRAFEHNVRAFSQGSAAVLIPEISVHPATGLPDAGALSEASLDPELLGQTVFIKLNGGLGTGMGLEKAKSLLRVKDGFTFLDLIARQILHLREQAVAPRVLLMNSFSTSADTLTALARYTELGNLSRLEFLQNRVPKIDAESLEPAGCPDHPELEWCPPGHGDIYVALAGSGMLDQLLEEGVRFAFVSNSDNLGATLDPTLLADFAVGGKPFVMEVTRRTASDRKGGHLCVNAENGQLILRESAQCPEEDTAAFQDIDRHQYFNTNNLWINLPALKAALDKNGGILPLPLIKNNKTLDPRDKTSRQVFQLETAMGAAIGCFEGAGAIVVPRSRFAPVKTTADLLALRSDAYVLTGDFRAELAASRDGIPPAITLDPDYYKMVDGLETLVTAGVPSLIGCRSLQVEGAMEFQEGTTVTGDVVFKNTSPSPVRVPPGGYADQVVTLG